jgi:hypothetical protein
MDKLTDCARCGSNACYQQEIDQTTKTWMCFTCGFSTSTLMVEGSDLARNTAEGLPELYKDLKFVDGETKVWYPATMTVPEKGMVFLDGTDANTWRWAAAKAVPILEEDKTKFPEEQTHKMDMKNIQYFDQYSFMDALDVIAFFVL